jgi:hypothetical protein
MSSLAYESFKDLDTNISNRLKLSDSMNEHISSSAAAISTTTSSIYNRQSSLIASNNLLLPWDRFSYWISAILVVRFDIEMGQSIESIYPSMMHLKLTNNDKLNIGYMSFPDSNSGFLGDTQFHFRFKLDSNTNHQINNLNVSSSINSKQTLSTVETNKTCANLTNLNNTTLNTSIKITHHNVNYEKYNQKTLSGLEVDKDHMFGYVYFRQVKDKSLKRGYFQKSIVLLSKLPFVSLFNYILSIISIDYFMNGAEVLETTCSDIDKWPLPIPGESLSLPLLGNLIEVCLPVKIDKYSLPIIYKKDLPSVPFTMPPIHEVNIYKSLQPILVHIHLLWELILLNESIVVIASLPSVCSELVQALISIIWPLKYASDYRPFFTIHNTEFAEYSSKNCVAPPHVVGVTNPFFTKCFQHWPNIIKISENNMKPLNNLTDQSKQTNESPKIKRTTNIKVVDSKPAVYSRYEPFLTKDKTILKMLAKGSESNRPYEAQSALLRRHFFELTQSFMIPLERYFSSLMPLQKTISPFKNIPKLKKFDGDEFLRNLKPSELSPLGTQLKGDLNGLYKRFFDSPNFKYWLEQKQKEAEKKLELLQLEILCDFSDLDKWLKNKQEIELIDQYMSIKKKLDQIESESNEMMVIRLKEILRYILNALPDDVRSILNK